MPWGDPTDHGGLEGEAGRVAAGALVLLPRDADSGVVAAEAAAGSARAPCPRRAHEEGPAPLALRALPWGRLSLRCSLPHNLLYVPRSPPTSYPTSLPAPSPHPGPKQPPKTVPQTPNPAPQPPHLGVVEALEALVAGGGVAALAVPVALALHRAVVPHVAEMAAAAVGLHARPVHAALLAHRPAQPRGAARRARTGARGARGGCPSHSRRGGRGGPCTVARMHGAPCACKPAQEFARGASRANSLPARSRGSLAREGGTAVVQKPHACCPKSSGGSLGATCARPSCKLRRAVCSPVQDPVAAHLRGGICTGPALARPLTCPACSRSCTRSGSRVGGHGSPGSRCSRGAR